MSTKFRSKKATKLSLVLILTCTLSTRTKSPKQKHEYAWICSGPFDVFCMFSWQKNRLKVIPSGNKNDHSIYDVKTNGFSFEIIKKFFIVFEITSGPCFKFFKAFFAGSHVESHARLKGYAQSMPNSMAICSGQKFPGDSHVVNAM